MIPREGEGTRRSEGVLKRTVPSAPTAHNPHYQRDEFAVCRLLDDTLSELTFEIAELRRLIATFGDHNVISALAAWDARWDAR